MINLTYNILNFDFKLATLYLLSMVGSYLCIAMGFGVPFVFYLYFIVVSYFFMCLALGVFKK